jgi:NitT/TauT family transport system substrate-binding protein
VFPLAQYGIQMPEDGVYALESTVKADPQMCRAFAKATLEGWKYAKEHPDEAMDAVMARVGESKLPTNEPHMSWMLSQILESTFPDASGKWTFGRLSEDTYNQASALLKRYGAIKTAPDYATFVKLEASGDVGP